MYSTIVSGALFGVSAYLVSVEVDIAQGLPGFTMVGLLGSEVRESRERVSVALKNRGFNLPPRRITVNLSPADKRKEGTGYDLPIAVGVLESMGLFEPASTKGILFLGELGLDGEIKKVRGVLPMVQEALRQGIRECIVPFENAIEGAVIPDIKVRGAGNLEQVFCFLTEPDEERREQIIPVFESKEEGGLHIEGKLPDFSEVNGQEEAKRAAEIAAAGFHNLLMVGPPGAGKSLIAKRIPGIMPPLTREESLEVTSIASVAGVLPEGRGLICERPFQNPHHSLTLPALIGGAIQPRPGILSLAHRGVLFLDELPEFQRNTLDSLRQPLEDKAVHIARIGGNITYPADAMLVCAMNPCPCGYYPDKNRCRCTEGAVKKYMGRISGPILDRIDLCVELHPVNIVAMRYGIRAKSSETIRERVLLARERQRERFEGTPYRFNGDIDGTHVEEYCVLGREEQDFMEQLYTALQLSVRAYHRILKVSRTIADLDGQQNIGIEQLTEAAFYRPSLEYWI